MAWFVTFKMKAMLDSVPGRATGKTGSRERREKSPDQHKPSGLKKIKCQSTIKTRQAFIIQTLTIIVFESKILSYNSFETFRVLV
jgi:hypothetical protein